MISLLSIMQSRNQGVTGEGRVRPALRRVARVRQSVVTVIVHWLTMRQGMRSHKPDDTAARILASELSQPGRMRDAR